MRVFSELREKFWTWIFNAVCCAKLLPFRRLFLVVMSLLQRGTPTDLVFRRYRAIACVLVEGKWCPVRQRMVRDTQRALCHCSGSNLSYPSSIVLYWGLLSTLYLLLVSRFGSSCFCQSQTNTILLLLTLCCHHLIQRRALKILSSSLKNSKFRMISLSKHFYANSGCSVRYLSRRKYSSVVISFMCDVIR